MWLHRPAVNVLSAPDPLAAPVEGPRRTPVFRAHSLDDLAMAISSCWDDATAWIDDWNPSNPARGQCGATALVLHDHRGGDLMSGLVEETPSDLTVHHWNVLDIGQVDLTWHQFGPTARIVQAEVVSRQDVLTTRWLRQRYETLASRVLDRLTVRTSRS